MRSSRFKSNDSNYEIMADLSLSTMGMLIIFLCIYVLVFNSKGALSKAVSLQSELAEKNSEISNLTSSISSLESENHRISHKNESLESEVKDLNSKLDTADQTIKGNQTRIERLAEERRAYGRYSGTEMLREYNGRCYSSSYKEYEAEIVFYVTVGEGEIVISQKSRKGVQVFHLRGTFEGNTFLIRRMDISEVQRRTVVSCGGNLVGQEVTVLEDYIIFGGKRFYRDGL